MFNDVILLAVTVTFWLTVALFVFATVVAVPATFMGLDDFKKSEGTVVDRVGAVLGMLSLYAIWAALVSLEAPPVVIWVFVGLRLLLHFREVVIPQRVWRAKFDRWDWWKGLPGALLHLWLFWVGIQALRGA